MATPIIVKETPRLPGMQPGAVGTAGEDKAGPNFVIVAVTPVLYYGKKLLWVYLRAWAGMAGTYTLGWALGVRGAVGLFAHVWDYLQQVSVLAAGATFVALITMTVKHHEERQTAMGNR